MTKQEIIEAGWEYKGEGSLGTLYTKGNLWLEISGENYKIGEMATTIQKGQNLTKDILLRTHDNY